MDNYNPYEDEIESLMDSLIDEDPSEQSYRFCYCGHPASEHQEHSGFCFNCDCMVFIPAECEVAS